MNALPTYKAPADGCLSSVMLADHHELGVILENFVPDPAENWLQRSPDLPLRGFNR